jgi:hypothetical protein
MVSRVAENKMTSLAITSWLSTFWSWFWTKSTWLQAIQLTNIMLSAHNHKGEIALKSKYKSVTNNLNWPILDDSNKEKNSG